MSQQFSGDFKKLRRLGARRQAIHSGGPPRRPQAVILAAGRGSRMNGHGTALPKCLLPVGGRTLLEHQLDALNKRGITDVCVVTGYLRELVEQSLGSWATTIHNPHWAETNSLFSLSLTQNWVTGSVVVMNCDVLAHPDIFDRLLERDASCFAYDSSSGSDEEHMKVRLTTDGHLSAMSKSMPGNQVHGENVGILHFDAPDADTLFDHADLLLAEGGRAMWLASAVQNLAGGASLTGIDVCDLPWTEIDFPDDLSRARSSIWPRICEAGYGKLAMAHKGRA